MAKIRVLENYCKGCGLCVPACPKNILYIRDTVDHRGVHVVAARDDIECIACLQCTSMCPDAALEVDEDGD